MVDYSKSPPARKTIAPKFEDGTAKRAQWVSPIVVSPADPNRILFGAQFVFVSDDQGGAWRKASPDLTNFDPQKQGNIPFSTLFAIAESPLKKGVIWAGTDDGNVQVTQNDGATWTNVSAGLPKDRFIAWLEASRSAEGTAYVVVNGKRNDDFETYVYKTEDFGSTWKSIKSNLPGGSANVIKEDPANPKILYLGTDLGVYVTTDGGKRWETLGSKLPTVYVHDIAINTKENVMIIATHGRGCFAIPLDAIRTAAASPARLLIANRDG